MKIALVISLNFNPGHVSHLLASYLQFREIGIKSLLYIDKKFISFIPDKFEYIVKGENINFKVDYAFFLFPSSHNLLKIIQYKLKYKTKIIYLFHEPIESLSNYTNVGFSLLQIVRIYILHLFNSITVFMSDLILLPSIKALFLYKKNKIYCNKNFFYLPLMFSDENDTIKFPRKYFSYIGTIAKDHSFDMFIQFVEKCIKKNDLINYSFLIATKSILYIDIRLQKLIDSRRLKIIQGYPLTNEEINSYYKQSLVIWNAYFRTNQSGVLAKSFMFGVPAIVLKKNLSEFVQDKREVIAIDDNTSYDEIKNALILIHDQYPQFEKNARQSFIDNFYYRKYNEKFSSFIS